MTKHALLPVLLLMAAVAVAPLLRADSPCSHDSAFHYYRIVAMRHALQDGLLFTRYLPDLAFGYGYPFFNYRAPLSYYLGLALYSTGLPLPVALNLVYVLSLLASAVAAYLLADDLFGPWAGLVAGVAYAYAPYQFLDALLRANMPESVALLTLTAPTRPVAPADLDTAAYEWQVASLQVASGQVASGRWEVGRISVTAPERVFVQPPVDVLLDVPVGDVATLVGFSMQVASGKYASGK